MKKYIIYKPNNYLLKNINVKILFSYNFIFTYIIEIKKELECVLHDNCVYFEELSVNIANSQLKKVREFVNTNKLYARGYLGNGVCVAVIDTGCAFSVDLCVPINRIKYFKDFTSDSVNMYDDNGHGTFVCGVIAGNGLQSCGEYSGIAPQSDLIVLKALDINGEGSQNNILNAMQWIIDNKSKFNIRVVCMSFGCKKHEGFDALSYGAIKLWQSGIVVVTAAGNDGPNLNSITSPGVANVVITVGALDNLLGGKIKVAPYSSRGDKKLKGFKPDILAPGTNLISLSNKIGMQTYTAMSGTSTSAPVIAGVCALILQSYPKATPDMVKSYLMNNAIDIGESNFVQGKGVFKFC